jgi:vacuolar-type H+-ATPase subunit F/Vma7
MSTDQTPTIAVVGRAEIVAPFRAAGLAAVAIEPGPGAAGAVQALVDRGCQVVFFTEDLHHDLAPVIERYHRSPTPSLVALPVGSQRLGMARLREIVRRAVGADVLAAGRTAPGKEQRLAE